jgi:hypothetical protein
MQREEFIRVLFSAAAFLKAPLESVVGQSLKDAYAITKAYLVRKLGRGSPAQHALDRALEKPETAPPDAATGLEMDGELRRLGDTLAALLSAAAREARQSVRVTGQGNHVQVAGGDIVTIARLVRRTVLTPGEGHLSPTQRRQLVVLIGEVADRFAGEDGRPRFGAVHAMLQQRFGVISYLMIPTARFAEAVSFLKRQRAINRSRLRRRNLAVYRADYLRIIHARRITLGWLKPQLYGFAEKELELKKPLTSLLSLGPLQLRLLTGLMGRETRR